MHRAKLVAFRFDEGAVAAQQLTQPRPTDRANGGGATGFSVDLHQGTVALEEHASGGQRGQGLIVHLMLWRGDPKGRCRRGVAWVGREGCRRALDAGGDRGGAFLRIDDRIQSAGGTRAGDRDDNSDSAGSAAIFG